MNHTKFYPIHPANADRLFPADREIRRSEKKRQGERQ